MANDTYIFGRGYISSTRLNLQHFLWKGTFDCDVHPTIPLEIDDAFIADVGTGTGCVFWDAECLL